jgi:glycine cleavage system P protein (glycine dehydrogenase) subunit 1
VVDHLAGRAEFYTAYTPYQPEASQGSLQAFFEYQTLICQLTGMDVSNASLYEGASALAEAVLMAMGASRRRRVVIASAVHPEYRHVLATYLANTDATVVEASRTSGVTDPAEVFSLVDDQTAAVVFQHPNFFGCLEQPRALTEAAHEHGALAIAAVDPVSLGLLERPGDYGADIVVAEGQSLGTPLGFGGPYLGIMAARESHMRKLPGRLVGQTLDRCGRRTFVLTLQTREQHIRRDKATSNICTNQGLLALRATIYLAAMGPTGLRAAADLAARKARYLADRLHAIDGFRLRFGSPFLREFVLQCETPVHQVLDRLEAADIVGGVPLGRFCPDLADCLLVAVTEKRTRAELDRYASALSGT